MFPSSQKSRQALLDPTEAGTLHMVYIWIIRSKDRLGTIKTS